LNKKFGINKMKLNTVFILSLQIIFYITFQTSLIAKPKNNLQKAIAAMELGLFKEALNQIDLAKSKDPKNAEVYKLKALLHEAIGEKNKAIKSWDICKKNTKDLELIKEANIHLDYLNNF